MPDRRLRAVIDGRLQLAPGPLLLSSAQSSWSGFLLERLQVSAGYARSLFWPRTRVVLVATGRVSIEDRALPGDVHFIAGPGSVTVWPGGHESRSLSWSGACQVVDVEIDVSTLGRLAQCDDRLARMAVAPQPGIQDPQAAALVHGMVAEVEAGCPAGRLYGESLSLALAAYVFGRYSTALTESGPLKGVLSKRQLERVLDYVRANLGSDLSLTQLAAVAQLSARQFCSVFRHSLGVTPHQYLIRERVSEAKKLLAARRMSIGEVALTVGFANQSHFTEVFHRATGTTPRGYQQGR